MFLAFVALNVLPLWGRVAPLLYQLVLPLLLDYNTASSLCGIVSFVLAISLALVSSSLAIVMTLLSLLVSDPAFLLYYALLIFPLLLLVTSVYVIGGSLYLIFSHLTTRKPDVRLRAIRGWHIDGYCYLRRMPKDKRAFAVVLGRWPRTDAVLAWVEANLDPVDIPYFYSFGGTTINHSGVPSKESAFPNFYAGCCALTSRLFGDGEDLFDDSPQRQAVLSPNVDAYLRRYKHNALTVPYDVPPHMQSLLSHVGLGRPNHFAPKVVHPVHKILELNMLRLAEGWLAGKRFSAYWVNPDKLVSWRTAPERIINPCLVPKDVRRFKQFADVFPPSTPTGSPFRFLHDSLHHLSNAEVGSYFDADPDLMCLIATVVVPLEVAWRGSSLEPNLYQLSYPSRKLFTYTPENDTGGRYTQRSDSVRWLSGSRLISPAGECLHTGVIVSTYAHHLVMISRPCYAKDQTAISLPPTFVVPHYVMPGASLSERITSPAHLQKLRDFTLSNTNMTWREAMIKMRQLAVTSGDRVTTAGKNAAAEMAMYEHMHAKGGASNYSDTWTYWTYRSRLMPSWILSPALGALRSSMSIASSASELELPKIELVSSSRDERIGAPGDNCDLRVGLFYEDPRLAPWERFYVRYASVSRFMVGKAVGGFVIVPALQNAHRLVDIGRFLAFRLSVQVFTPGYIVMGLVLSSYFGWEFYSAQRILYSMGHWAQDRVPIVCRFFWGWFFGLSPVTKRRVGYHPVFMLYHPFFFLTIFFKDLFWPVYGPYIFIGWMPQVYERFRGESAVVPIFRNETFLVPDPTAVVAAAGSFQRFFDVPVLREFLSVNSTVPVFDHYARGSVNPYVRTMVVANVVFYAVFLLVCVSFVSMRLARRGVFLPFHRDAEAGDVGSETASFVTADDGDDSDDEAPPPTPPPVDVRHLRPPSLLAIARAAPPELAASRSFLAPVGPFPGLITAPLPAVAAPTLPTVTVPPLPPPAPPNLGPVAPPDPFRFYQFLPSNFEDLRTFALTCRHLPAPANMPPAARMCVWNAIGAVYGIDSAMLWAVYMSQGPRRADIVNGAVPMELLPTVLSWFMLSGQAHVCESIGGVPMCHDTANPVVFASPTPWMTVSWSIVINDRDPAYVHLEPIPATFDTNKPAIAFNVINVMVGAISRTVPYDEMRLAFNVPQRVYNRVIASLAGFGLNASSMILPSRSVTWQGNFNTQPLAPTAFLPDVPLRFENVPHTTTVQDLHDAKLLARDIKRYPAVLELADTPGPQLAAGMSACADHAQPRDVMIGTLNGAPGVGKTVKLVECIQAHVNAGGSYRDVTIVTWTEPLRAELEMSLRAALPDLTSENFFSGCKPLMRCGEFVIFDDATMFWKGYFQLILALHPHIKQLLFTYDSCQGSRIFPQANSMSRAHVRTTQAWLNQFSSTYATRMRRLSVENCQLLGFSGMDAVTHGEVALVTKPPPGIPFLVVSPRFAETKNNGGAETYAMSEVQGLTWRGDIAIDLGGLSGTATDALMYTALTRCTGTIWLVMTPMINTPSTLDEQSWGSSLIVSAMLAVCCSENSPVLNINVDRHGAVRRAVQTHMARSLPAAAAASLGISAQPVVAGYVPYDDAPMAHELLQGHPDHWFLTPRSFNRTSPKSGKNQLSYLNRVEHEYSVSRFEALRRLTALYIPMTLETKILKRKEVYVPPARRQLAPPAEDFEMRAGPVHDPDAEISHPKCVEKTNVYLVDGPESAQKHTRMDMTLDEISKDKRAPGRRDDPKLNAVDRQRLKQLKSGFRVFFSVPSQAETFDDQLFDDCFESAFASWFAGRSMKRVISSLRKWEVDDPLTFIRLFLKGQWIKKLDAAGKPVKSGQIVAEGPVALTFRDAPIAEYMRRRLYAWKHPNVMINMEMNPTQVSDWYTANWKAFAGTFANDYTGFDTGCDRVFLAFDLWLKEMAGIPLEERDFYFHRRTTATTYRGPYPIMQPSGDRYTFLYNTVRNAAITAASRDIPVGTPAAFGGDDSVVQGYHAHRRGFIPSQWPMKPKPVEGYSAEFCGMIYGLDKLYMSAKGLNYRARVAVQRGERGTDFWRSARDQYDLVDHDEIEAGRFTRYYRFAQSRNSAIR